MYLEAYDKAIEVYDKAIDLDEKQDETSQYNYLYLGICYAKSGNIQEAIS